MKKNTNVVLEEKPSQDTLDALNEKEAMKDKNKYKRYDSFSSLLEEVK